MNDEPPVIHQDPFSPGRALHPDRPKIHGLEVVFDRLGQGPRLTDVQPGHDQEKFSERDRSPEVEDDDVLRFLV